MCDFVAFRNPSILEQPAVRGASRDDGAPAPVMPVYNWRLRASQSDAWEAAQAMQLVSARQLYGDCVRETSVDQIRHEAATGPG
jgi:hypothetical protein